MRSFLFRCYWKLEKLIFPALKFSQHNYYETLRGLIPKGCSWIDLGCGHQMFPEWMTAEQHELGQRAARLIGIDLDGEGLRKNPIVSGKVFGTLERLPFQAGIFDIATANMVIEHVENPTVVLREIGRVLRPGGLFIFHTTNVRSVMIRLASKMPQGLKNFLANVIEGRKEEDVFPTFYRLNTLQAITRDAPSCGFDVQQIRAVSTSAVTALLGPVAIVELAYLRLIENERFNNYRSNLIVVLQKAA